MEASGVVKVRLVHAQHGSILLPDLSVVGGHSPYWLQPQWVYAPLLNLDGSGSTTLYVGIANSQELDVIVRVSFHGRHQLASLPDRSHTYACFIEGPTTMPAIKAGRCRLRSDGGVNLRLYHHTTKAAKKSILSSGQVWGSAWNFQGNKKLLNCSYAYFTSLQRIETPYDLQRIAMAGNGRIPLRLDQTPDGYPPDLVIDVYRESTKNRQAALGLWVPAEHIAPSHIWKHTTRMVEYEVAHPWIFRVGLTTGGRYYFERDVAAADQPDVQRFNDIVIGDCTTRAGLAAPYDEEDTRETFLVQDVSTGSFFDFWRRHGNQVLWNKDEEAQRFGTPS